MVTARARVLTAAVALPLALALIRLAPARLFVVVVVVLTVWALAEVVWMTDAGRAGGVLVFLAGTGVLGAVLCTSVGAWAVGLAAVGVLSGELAWVAVAGGQRLPRGVPLAALGALYAGGLFPYFILLRARPQGVALLTLVLAIVVAADTAAYFWGSLKGRVRLLVQVSPKKTVEGAVAGLIASIAAGIVVAPVVGLGLRAGRVAGFSAALGAMAEVGDLAGSAFKRVCGVKDSGWVFPGHGGLLDRATSLAFAAVLAYYYNRVFL